MERLISKRAERQSLSAVFAQMQGNPNENREYYGISSSRLSLSDDKLHITYPASAGLRKCNDYNRQTNNLQAERTLRLRGLGRSVLTKERDGFEPNIRGIPMPRLTPLIIMIGAVLTATSLSRSQWEPTSGPSGGPIDDLLACGKLLYAGGTGGLQRSSNSGESWTWTGLTNTRVWCIASRGTEIFAGTYDGVFISTSAGDSWIQANSGLTNTVITAIAVTDTSILAGTNGAGVFRSADGGGHWTPSSDGIQASPAYIWSLGVMHSAIFVGTSNGAFRSLDGGKHWSGVSGITQGATVQSFASFGDVCFAGTNGSGLFRSTDGGEQWAVANVGLNSLSVSDLAVWQSSADSTVIFASTGMGIFLSSDFGSTWKKANKGLTELYSNALAVSDSTVYVGTNDGVFSSRNCGDSWDPRNDGLTMTLVTSFAGSDSLVFAGTSGSGVYVTTNRGLTWTRSEEGMLNPVANDLASLRGRVYAAGYSNLYCSSDGGDSWTDTWAAGVSANLKVLATIDTSLCVGTSGKGVFISSDQGVTWDPRNNGLPDLFVSALVSSDSILYAGTSNGLSVSIDHGELWTQGSQRISEGVTALALSGRDVFVGTFSHLYRSTDNGESWMQSDEGLLGHEVLCLAAVHGTLVAGGPDGIFRSTNLGATWSAVNDGLLNRRVIALHADDVFLYAGSMGGGTWRRSLSEVVSSSRGKENPIAEDFFLEPCYPNPFNPRTSIIGEWAAYSKVELVVFDLLGQKVATLAAGMYRPGKYVFTFDGTDLASGVYFYRLAVGGKSSVRTMLLMR